MELETAAVLRDLGRRIAELRRARGLTQEKAAERLGMLAPNYARIEQGRLNVTIDTLVRIVRMLGDDVTIADLFAPPATAERRSGETSK
ncbi:helix-turn-helix domain-containing protein [Sorangium sp. So ce1667]